MSDGLSAHWKSTEKCQACGYSWCVIMSPIPVFPRKSGLGGGSGEEGFSWISSALAITMIWNRYTFFFLPSLCLFWTLLPILLFTVPLLCRSFLLSHSLYPAIHSPHVFIDADFHFIGFGPFPKQGSSVHMHAPSFLEVMFVGGTDKAVSLGSLICN